MNLEQLRKLVKSLKKHHQWSSYTVGIAFSRTSPSKKVKVSGFKKLESSFSTTTGSFSISLSILNTYASRAVDCAMFWVDLGRLNGRMKPVKVDKNFGNFLRIFDPKVDLDLGNSLPARRECHFWRFQQVCDGNEKVTRQNFESRSSFRKIEIFRKNLDFSVIFHHFFKISKFSSSKSDRWVDPNRLKR